MDTIERSVDRILLLTGPQARQELVLRPGGIAVEGDSAHVREEGGRFLLRGGPGTTFHGSQVSQETTIELEPGTEVVSGHMRWVLLPANWFVLHVGSLVVYGRASRALNYAAFRCGLPVVDGVRAVNTGHRASDALVLRVALERFGGAVEAAIPRLGAGESAEIGGVSPELNGPALRAVTEPVDSVVSISLGTAETRFPLRVLGMWHWSHEPEARQTVAAFVSPRDPEIERFVLDAQRGSEGLLGVLKRGEADAELRVMQVIYEHLAKSGVRYEAPAAGEAFQMVRPSSGVLRGSQGGGAGTCLDLTLLFAGCLEHLGLCPLVVLVGDLPARPSHAFVGCWVGSSPGFRPVIRDVERVRAEVESGNLLVVECTGAAAGAHARADEQTMVPVTGDGRLPFDRGVRCAVERIGDTPWACAVDVASLRPPYGSVTPLMHPTLSPIATQVYAAALDFANSKRSKNLESVHLLYGLLSVQGEVTAALLGRVGMDVGIARRKLASVVPVGNSVLEPTPTRNYRKCARLAEHCAETVPGATGQEEHVWWSLLENPSTNFITVSGILGIDREQLTKELETFFPGGTPGMGDSSQWIEPLV